MNCLEYQKEFLCVTMSVKPKLTDDDGGPKEQDGAVISNSHAPCSLSHFIVTRQKCACVRGRERPNTEVCLCVYHPALYPRITFPEDNVFHLIVTVSIQIKQRTTLPLEHIRQNQGNKRKLGKGTLSKVRNSMGIPLLTMLTVNNGDINKCLP